MTTTHITLGSGQLPPHGVVGDQGPEKTPATSPTEGRALGKGPVRGRAARLLLAGAAVLSPLLGTAFVALDPGTLPREAAADFLPPIAEHPGTYLLATVMQVGAMGTGLALAVLVGLALGRRFPRLAGLTAVLLTLGYLGGAGFAGAKLVAADLVADGQVRPGAEAVWDAVRTGPLFDVMSWPLLMALPGMMLLAVLLWRARSAVGRWPGALLLLGFVASSGEFPQAVTILGWAMIVPAVAALARSYVLGRTG